MPHAHEIMCCYTSGRLAAKPTGGSGRAVMRGARKGDYLRRPSNP